MIRFLSRADFEFIHGKLSEKTQIAAHRRWSEPLLAEKRRCLGSVKNSQVNCMLLGDPLECHLRDLLR